MKLSVKGKDPISLAGEWKYLSGLSLSGIPPVSYTHLDVYKRQHVGIDQYNGKEIKHYKLREGNRELDPLLNINWTFLDKTGTLNPRIVSPPKKRMASRVTNVVPDVLIVRDRVALSALFTFSRRSRLG